MRIEQGSGVMKAATMVLMVMALGLNSVAVALDIGGALDKAAQTAQKAQTTVKSARQPASAGTVPSGAVPLMRQVDKRLDRMDLMLSDESAKNGKEYRVKEAAFCLRQAQEGMQTIEKRYGAKMGKDHPDLVSRHERIAAGEKKIEALKAATSDAAQPVKPTDQPSTSGTRQAKSTTQPAASGTVPSGAVTLMEQVDKKLDRTDLMMNDESTNRDKDYRVKEAVACLKEAQEGVQTIERRYGAKMGMDHPDLVSRRERIAAAEKKLEAFRGEMGTAIQKEKDAYAAKDKAEAARYAAQNEKAAKDAAQRTEALQKASAEPASAGKILFSKSPIDPAHPANLTNSFKAGDSIYGLIQADKNWRDLFNAKDKAELGIMIVMAVGENETYQYITLKKAAYIDSNQLVLDIAPAPDKMTAYKDPDIQFGEGKGNRKIGPIAFTYDLAQLPAGKHTVKFFIRNYGDKLAAGELEIEGADFKFYADLHEKVKAASEAIATMPKPGMVNKELESEMHALLKNAGWPAVLRLVIKDKDWWLNRMDGGDTPITSRHIAAAVAAKGPDGKYYYRIVVFEQPRTISGWGKLEITQQSDPKPIAEENIDK